MKSEPEYKGQTFLRWLDERTSWYDRLASFFKNRKAREKAKRTAYLRQAIESPGYNDIRRNMMWAEHNYWQYDDPKIAEMFRKRAEWYDNKMEKGK